MSNVDRGRDLRDIAAQWNLSLTDEQLKTVAGMVGDLLGMLEGLDDESDSLPNTRSVVHSPPVRSENPYNAWTRRFSIKSANAGMLSGKTIALKEVIAVAGVPMTAGSVVLEELIPRTDATVVDRIVAHGGEVTGYATTEDMCITGASISSTYGFVRNPRDPSRSAGGSSSGCAALVAAGSCDMSVGADQGGSIRVPASLCGVFGLKPTFGLVPYTGAIPIDPAIDHLGPLASNTRDLATLLQAIAGYDGGRDPRQDTALSGRDYIASLDQGIDGLRVGVLAEGITEDTEDRVIDEFNKSVTRLGVLGVHTVDVSVPVHADALQVHVPIILPGFANILFELYGIGIKGKGFYDAALSTAMADGLKKSSGRLHPAVQTSALVGRHLWESSGAKYYARAQNKALMMRGAYDRALDEVDVLIMPTTLICAPPLPPEDVDPFDAYMQTMDMRLVANTCSFNQTGHPVITIPIGSHPGLPVGLSVVARHADEMTLLRVAAALESSGHVYRQEVRDS